MLFLFADREAEVAQFSSEGEVFAVSKGHEAALLESEEHQIRLAVCIAAAFYDFTGDEMI